MNALVGLCDSCGGECCKFVSIPLADVPGLLPDLDRPWLEARGTLYADGVWRIASRCRHLTDAGRCAIYATRPDSCRDYDVDGPSCRRARAQANTALALRSASKASQSTPAGARHAVPASTTQKGAPPCNA